MFIDTHAHINFREYEGEIDDVLKRSFEAGVKKIVNIGSNYETSVKAVQMIKNVQNVKMKAVIGCHPIHLTQDITESAKFDGKEYKFKTKKEIFDKEKYQELIDQSRDAIVGIGETGLDYFHVGKVKDEKEIQKKVFQAHIELAIENNLPLVLHCRGSEEDPYGAYDEMIGIIENAKLKMQNDKSKFKDNLRGVIHCFLGNAKQVRKFIELGFYIGVNGIVTFKKSVELQEVIKKITLDKIVLETDCPFLAPDPYRGKRNEPMYIPVIAKKIAEIKNISVEIVEKQTTKNAEKLFTI